MHKPPASASVAITVLLALSCGKSPDGPPPPSGPALKIVAGAGISDTIEDTPPQGLVVQVLGHRHQRLLRPELVA